MWIKRAVVLGLTGLGLYVVWPSLAAVFSSGPQLRHVNPLWGIPIVLAELASFACMWALLRLALDVKPWFPIATAQLAGNAFSRIVPGGAAAGGAMQFDMLRQAGIGTTWAATGVTAVSLISTATLLGLPVISIVSILITGASVERNLFRVGSIAVVVCVGAIAGGAVLLFADRPLLWLGELVQRTRNRMFRRRKLMEGLPDRLVDERDLIRRVLGAGWWQALIFSAGNWLLDLTALLIALAAVGAEPRASVVLLAYVVAAFLGMIPITPGGLGFVEAGLVGTLSLAGIGTDQALLATLVYRLAAYWMPIPTGRRRLLHRGAQVRTAEARGGRRRGQDRPLAAGLAGHMPPWPPPRRRSPVSRSALGGRLAAVDQVGHRQHRMELQHPRSAVAHHHTYTLTHRRLVAVRLTVGAGGLVGAVAALLQAEARVGEELGTLLAEPAVPGHGGGDAGRREVTGVVVAAVQGDHRRDGLLLARQAARRSGVPVVHAAVIPPAAHAAP